MLVFHRPLLIAFGATDDIIDYASRYMSTYSFGTVFVQLSLGLNAYITAQGFSRVSMLTVLIGAVLNALLDPLFIFVFDLDVKGAALATIISQAVSTVFVLHFLTGPKTLLRLRLPRLCLNWRLLGPCVALGLSPFIMQSTESLIAICFNTSLRSYGNTIAVSSMTLCTSIMQLAMLPLQGLSQGAQPIISYNYGAGNNDRVKQGFWLLVKSAALLRFSTVFAFIAVMTMYTLRLLPQRAQLVVEFFVIMAQVVGILLLAVPIRRALTAQFGQEDNEGENE